MIDWGICNLLNTWCHRPRKTCDSRAEGQEWEDPNPEHGPVLKGATQDPPDGQRKTNLRREVRRPVEDPVLREIDLPTQTPSELREKKKHPRGRQHWPP